MKTIKFKAIKDVKSPQRDGRNAGYDLFVPKFTEEFLTDFYNFNLDYISECLCDVIEVTYENFKHVMVRYEECGTPYIIITPTHYNHTSGTHYNIKVPSGLVYAMEDSNDDSYTYMLKNTNKSGVASKNSVITGACAMDMEYRDEAIVNLIGFKPLKLKQDSKMIQVIIHRVEIPKMEFIPFNDDTDIFELNDNNRGGGFNSTGEGL